MEKNENDPFSEDGVEPIPSLDASNASEPVMMDALQDQAIPTRREVIKKNITRRYCSHGPKTERARKILSSNKIPVRDLRVVWSALQGNPHKSRRP